MVVNFGRAHKRPAQIVINKPEAIAKCKDKIEMKLHFSMAGVCSPDWWPIETSLCSLEYTGRVIYKPKHHSRGRGLVIFDSPEACVAARLGQGGTMEKFHTFSREYRVHIFAGHAINIDRKVLREGYEEQEIRHKTHYQYSRVVRYPDDLIRVAVAAVESLGLDFGAVDIGYDKHEKRCYALEVNSAPGMRDSLVERYLMCIRLFVDNCVDRIPQAIEDFERARREEPILSAEG